jgi:A/G-specific adenine glycosylase
MIKIEQLQNQIIKNYSKSGRDFPWRQTKDPYRIMIAEFMLHRTKAEQVVPVYNSFVKKYPDVNTLAKASNTNVKKVTEHLGLHWRSSHFIKAARFIVKNFNANFPLERELLLEIPGVGDYVSGAILSVCFDIPVYVVDSNIARFINRFYGLNLSGEIRRKKKVVEISGKLFNTKNPGVLLFSIIDFTSMFCKPRNPECNKCIFKKECKFSKFSLQGNT